MERSALKFGLLNPVHCALEDVWTIVIKTEHEATVHLDAVVMQYNGSNNGDLCAPMSKMRNRRWNSSDQMFKAKNELVEKGLIRVSRQGGLNKCNLYAMTWFSIDECDGKLDIASTITAPNDWKHSSDPHGGSDNS